MKMRARRFPARNAGTPILQVCRDRLGQGEWAMMEIGTFAGRVSYAIVT